MEYYRDIYKSWKNDHLKFWAKQSEAVTWEKKPKKISVVKHSDYDLVNNDDVRRMYDDQKPDMFWLY